MRAFGNRCLLLLGPGPKAKRNATYRKQDHHQKFLTRLEPSLAICSADYDNQYDHPCEEIRERLHEQGIRLMTTKTGDVIVRSTGDHTGAYQAINLIEKLGKESSRVDFVSKKSRILDANGDTLRQRYGLHKTHPR
ncbi:hypothetical protein [Bradyrhizobium sp. LA6.1]|uniref:hypothetical protein n=1 Tax=Bradyrhizobium sp. LA6.1 TaxID=3156378 RepID=UPI003399D91B